MEYLPLAFKVKAQKIIVVGGGNVALRKVKTFLEGDAEIFLFSPSAVPEIGSMAKKGLISWVKKKIEKDDITGARLVISAADDHIVNRNVSSWAADEGIPVNVVDTPLLSTVISPAVAEFDKAIVAVYTDAKDPVLSRDLKNYIREKWDDFLSYRNRS